MKIVLCSPGSNFSASFRKCWTETIEYFHQKNIQYVLADAQSCNIYYVRQMCLGGDLLRGSKQKPWNGRLDYDFMLWLDSDMVWTPKQIQKLIDYDVPIVSGYYAWEGGKGLTCGRWDIPFFRQNGYMPFYTESQLKNLKRDSRGLVDVDYIGFGFLLVKRGVFEKIDYPWFRPVWTEETINDINVLDFSMEDISACLQFKKQGFTVKVDPMMKIGHEKKAVY